MTKAEKMTKPEARNPASGSDFSYSDFGLHSSFVIRHSAFVILHVAELTASLPPNPQSPIPNPQSPIPNPQSPIPNPQSPIPKFLNGYKKLIVDGTLSYLIKEYENIFKFI